MVLDDGDGALNAEEVVRGFAKLKGPARSTDMCILHTRIDRIEDVLIPRGSRQGEVNADMELLRLRQRLRKNRTDADKTNQIYVPTDNSLNFTRAHLPTCTG